jgi:hypothetical protein
MRPVRSLVLPIALTLVACGSEAPSGGGGGGAPATPAVPATPAAPAVPATPAAPAVPAAPAKPTLDPSSPRALALSIFAIAKSGDLALLAPVADPQDADGDSKRVAGVAQAPEAKQAEFRTFFAKGTVKGEPRVDGDNAEVDILFGPDGTKDETFKMVKRDGRWYLQSF